MGEVERLLTAALVEIAPVDPYDDAAQSCLGQYFTELDRRFDAGFDPALSILPGVDELRPPQGLFLIARLRDEPIGCGGLVFHDGSPPDIKRMWVAPSSRGLGVGRRLLAELERRAALDGHRTVRLETNRTLTRAVAMYRAAGYREVPAFNDETYAHHWFEKVLAESGGDER
jgi:GNAT superfamily N-acetyltransferase